MNTMDWALGEREAHTNNRSVHAEVIVLSDDGSGGSGLSPDTSSQQLPQVTEENHRDLASPPAIAAPEPASGDGDGGSKSKSKICIRSTEQLRDAITAGALCEVESIDIEWKDIGRRGHFTIAEALASGQTSTLTTLSLQETGLEGDCSEAIGNALTAAWLPSCTAINLSYNALGCRGVQALGRAISSGSLAMLQELYLEDAGIDDADMATLACAFGHGEASPVPKLADLRLSGNSFTEVGLQALSEVLISGRLESLRFLFVKSTSSSSAGGTPSEPSEGSANALVSAPLLNNCLTVNGQLEWHKFPDRERRYNLLRERNVAVKHRRELRALFL